ncbi:hypothetical protein HLBS07_32880 [Vibrio alginolyticus]|nr:hypothetical protein HLBS07_32880 [Vibrio alginolyticus]
MTRLWAAVVRILGRVPKRSVVVMPLALKVVRTQKAMKRKDKRYKLHLRQVLLQTLKVLKVVTS